MINVTSAFAGLSSGLPDLYSQIAACGWSVKKVNFDKKQGCFVAVAQSPYGEQIEKTGDRDSTAVANLLIAVTRKNNMRSSAQRMLSAWTYTFTDKLKEVSEAYVKAPIYDPKAAAAFKELADDSTHRAKVLEEQLQVLFTPNPEPYTDAEKMAEDIHKRRKLEVSTANVEHPLWTREQMLAFRLCFDVLGYAVAGAGWDWRGDNLAFAAYAPLVSANAQEALFAEVIGQSAYANRYRAYGPQKVATFPTFLKAAQEAEGIHPKYQGEHPSQSAPPVPAPAIQPFKRDKDAPYPLPHHAPVGLTPLSRVKFPQPAGIDSSFADPNSAWSSGIAPMQPNAYLDHGDPLDFQQSMDTAKLIDTEWSQFTDGENKPDYERMKLAITNAFRAAILSPMKNLAFNAVHYQDIAHIPAGVSDPEVYWNTLNKRREAWNTERGFPAHSHREYYQYIKQITNVLYKMDTTQNKDELNKRVEDMIEDWVKDEEEHVLRAEREKPEDKRMMSDEVERLTFKGVTQRCKVFLQEKKDGIDQREAASEPAEGLEEPAMEYTKNPLEGKYAGFIAGHLRSIAQISDHADDLLKAALEDVHEHDGSGHHFRSVALQLGISGVNAKVASFTWLLLQPTTSELATIDRHILAVLGYGEDDLNTRDYFRMERELAAGRDASGYGHMPLGAFQWAIWDNRRTGEGSHQDHSALKAIDPTPYNQIDWREPVNVSGRKTLSPALPDWWEATAPAREQVAQEWNETPKATVGKDKVPYNYVNAPVMAKVADAEERKHQFVIEWNKRTPIKMEDAKILGEYAAGAKLSHDEAEDYAEDNQSDVDPGFPDTFEDFKEEFMHYFDKFHQSKVSAAVRTPWFTHPQTKERVQGQPGQSIMTHATQHLGLTTPEVWEQLVEAGKG